LGLSALGAAGLLLPVPVAAQAADRNAEARVYFEQGNRHFEAAMGLRGQRKRERLERALQAYVQSLRIVRSRNAVFNAAVVLEELGRYDEAFAYLTEYLSIPGLSDEERAAAAKRRDALRDQVAVLRVESEPSGAQVRIDRLDLAPRGTTPTEIALPPGEHTVFVDKPGYERARERVTARLGAKVEAKVTLEPEPVELRVEAEGEGTLLVDGEVAEPGATFRLAPGEHVLRLRRPDGPDLERRIHLEVGAEPQVVALRPSPEDEAVLIVESEQPAEVAVDGAIQGRGRQVRVRVERGLHRVRVTAEGHVPYEGVVAARPGQRTVVAVELAEELGDRSRFGRAPLVLGVTTAALAATTVGLIVGAGLRKDDHDAFVALHCTPDCAGNEERFARAQELADEVDRFNLAADIGIGVSAAAGVTALVLGLLNRSPDQPPSSARVSLAPVARGARLTFAYPLGRP
jgi:hypothetical protein